MKLIGSKYILFITAVIVVFLSLSNICHAEEYVPRKILSDSDPGLIIDEFKPVKIITLSYGQSEDQTGYYRLPKTDREYGSDMLYFDSNIIGVLFNEDGETLVFDWFNNNIKIFDDRHRLKRIVKPKSFLKTFGDIVGLFFNAKFDINFRSIYLSATKDPYPEHNVYFQFYAKLTGFHKEEYKDFFSSYISRGDIANWHTFLKELKEHKGSVKKYVWDSLDKELRNRINRWKTADEFDLKDYVLDELNEILDKRDFYNKQAFNNFEIPDECKKLLEKGISNLGEYEIQRFNRLLLESIFPGNITRGHRCFIGSNLIIVDKDPEYALLRELFQKNVLKDKDFQSYSFDKEYKSNNILLAVRRKRDIVLYSLRKGKVRLLKTISYPEKKVEDPRKDVKIYLSPEYVYLFIDYGYYRNKKCDDKPAGRESYKQGRLIILENIGLEEIFSRDTFSSGLDNYTVHNNAIYTWDSRFTTKKFNIYRLEYTGDNPKLKEILHRKSDDKATNESFGGNSSN